MRPVVLDGTNMLPDSIAMEIKLMVMETVLSTCFLGTPIGNVFCGSGPVNNIFYLDQIITDNRHRGSDSEGNDASR